MGRMMILLCDSPFQHESVDHTLNLSARALGVEVEKRGLSNRLVPDVKLVDYDGMVDLLFSGATVVNL